jgi:heptosyltransferase-2
LGLSLPSPAAELFPTADDRFVVNGLLDQTGRTIAFHPGSGSETKNWPIENWISLGDAALAKDFPLIIVAGEADTRRTQRLKMAWKGRAVRFAANLPLPHLAALLERCSFVGHDSGISHIAAAVGARCLLLFGPTDPAFWAPAYKSVSVLGAPEGKIERLEFEPVAAALWAALGSSSQQKPVTS